MIQKFFIFCIGIFFYNVSIAQCTPDASLTEPGYLPDTLRNGKVSEAYSETITVRAFRDTVVKLAGNNVNARIDSIKVTNVRGLPPGISYQCLNPRCIFIPLINSCVLLSGTPTQNGVYPLDILITAYAKINGTFAATQRDTISRFAITVNGTINNAKISVNEKSFFVYPNPATNAITIYNRNKADIEIFSADGKKVMEIKGGNAITYNLSIEKWNAGMYYILTKENYYKFIKN